MDTKVRVGVIGASGYIGSELLRYLSIHPKVEIAWACAKKNAGTAIDSLFPNLKGFAGGTFINVAEAESAIKGLRAVFIALPHNESQTIIPRLAAANADVIFIDMGGDFRANDPSGYQKWYGHEHSAPDWLPNFVYGFTEFQRKYLIGAKLIANPGCFATSILLALAPLAERGCLSGDVFLVGITGSSGAGNALSLSAHHPQRAANLFGYKTLLHQHIFEVQSFLGTLTNNDFHLHFSPQSGPFVRGIFTTIFLPGLNVAELEAIYQNVYRAEPLITVGKGSPELRWVVGTPRSHIGISGDDKTAVVFVALDNLGKGAAGQAIQNFNLAAGFTETEGLLLPGGFV